MTSCDSSTAWSTRIRSSWVRYPRRRPTASNVLEAVEGDTFGGRPNRTGRAVNLTHSLSSPLPTSQASNRSAASEAPSPVFEFIEASRLTLAAVGATCAQSSGESLTSASGTAKARRAAIAHKLHDDVIGIAGRFLNRQPPQKYRHVRRIVSRQASIASWRSRAAVRASKAGALAARR